MYRNLDQAFSWYLFLLQYRLLHPTQQCAVFSWTFDGSYALLHCPAGYCWYPMTRFQPSARVLLWLFDTFLTSVGLQGKRILLRLGSESSVVWKIDLIPSTPRSSRIDFSLSIWSFFVLQPANSFCHDLRTPHLLIYILSRLMVSSLCDIYNY